MGVSFHIAEEYRQLLARFGGSHPQAVPGTCAPSNRTGYDPLRPLPLGQVRPLLGRLRLMSSDVPIEWRVGEYLASNTIDMVTSRALGSHSVAEALAVAYRHQHIQTNVRSFSIREAARGELTEFHYAAEDDPDMRFILHTLIAAKIWLLFHFHRGSSAQHQIDRSATCFGSLLHRFARNLDFLDIEFRENELMLNIGRDLLAQPLPDMGERQRKTCDQELERRSASVSCAISWTDRVRAYIRSSCFADVSVDDACDSFRISRRTLGRLLRDEGTSFSTILSDLRREKALHLVQSTGLPLKRVAAELGFNSDASFSMAFKSWTGVPPKSFRKHGPVRPASRPTSHPELRLAS